MPVGVLAVLQWWRRIGDLGLGDGLPVARASAYGGGLLPCVEGR
jgi:hypothetical protein